MSEDNEIELRAHIRHLLLDYALTHLTTDYVVYTQSAVAEVRILVGTHILGYPYRLERQLLLDILVSVPTVDPTNPQFESSIYNTLRKLKGYQSVEQYNENLPCTSKSAAYLKNALSLTYQKTLLPSYSARASPTRRVPHAKRNRDF